MSNALATLDWPRLFETLVSLCHTPYGEKSWQTLQFFEEITAAQAHIEAVEALKQLILRFGDPIVQGNFFDVDATLSRVALRDSLSLDELGRIHQTLVSGEQYHRHFLLKAQTLFTIENGTFAKAASYINEPVSIKPLLDELNQLLDTDQSIKPNATARYGELLRRIRSERQQLMRRMEGYLQQGQLAGIFQNATITEREGRYVLPVKIEYRSKLPGLVHASSGSGSTLFIEPQGVIELNNQLLSLFAELQTEIEKILQQAAEHLRTHAELLSNWLEQLGLIDRHAAAARLSRLLDASPIQLRRQGGFYFQDAKHPLLLLQHLDNKKTVVANDLELGIREDDSDRTLLITGPNTGGKTVILKLAGLFALMLKAGLHIPAHQKSWCRFFDGIYADIGDQQSLLQNLSTFSAHIIQLKNWVSDETDLSNSLVLIDEIAAGTDPSEGAALAKAILDKLYQKGALTIATTHLGELKIEAHQHTGYINASVEFNTETLSPTYRLLLGVPGTSNAIAIAQRLGIGQAIIEKARGHLAVPVRDVADLISDLELKNQKTHEALEQAEAARQQATEDAEKIAEERAYLESEKRRILQQYQSQLKARVHDLDAELRELRKNLRVEADNLSQLERLSGDVKAIGNLADEVFEEREKQIEVAERVDIRQLEIGQSIYSKRLGLKGEIISKSDQEVIIQSGLMRLTIPAEDIQRHGESRRKQKKSFRDQIIENHRNQSQYKGSKQAASIERYAFQGMELDVRGQHSDEAIRQLSQFLDEAVLQGLQHVGVIHGLGTGALKKSIRQYLANAPYVKHYRPAEAIDGGDGKTVIDLN